MSDRLARLRGHLDVLVAMREELRAIGAPVARVERHRAQIARVRAELTRAERCREFGNAADATHGPQT